MNTTLPKHIHVIGICGVATSALAIAFHKKGSTVTGSDKGFFPPVSTELEKQGVSFYAGWHPEKMTEKGTPDVIIVGTASGTHNPETTYARERGIPIYSFAEAIGHFFAKENSICCTGTWGKTSSSALLSFILESAGIDPTYMFGGVSLSHDSSAKLTDSKWSIFEGDEYKSSPTDPTAKFFYYKPTHLLLTAVSWDHADLYPTEESYFDVFKKVIAKIPDHGFIVAQTNHPGVKKVLENCQKKVVTYGERDTEYTHSKVTQTKGGISFTISFKDEFYNVRSPLIGAFQAENITGCFAIAHQIGIQPDIIIKAVSEFKGLKRRLEKRLVGDITIFDDIAHSPEKASSVLMNLRSVYNGKIIAVFEPNIGGRRRESLGKYDNAFENADKVIIPRLTKLKTAESEKDQPVEGDELAQIISKTHSNVNYIGDDEKLVEHLISQVKNGDVIVFLGSHGFRSMIEETVRRLS